MMDVFERVRKIIVRQLNVDEGNVTLDALFIDDLGSDSIDSVELLMAFEVGFNIEISEEEAEKLLTVGDAVRFIEAAV
jgi:acyl carrier protein